MSTNAFLFVHIPKEHDGKTVIFNSKLLPKGIVLHSPDIFDNAPVSVDKIQRIVLKEGFLRIYVHWDGDPLGTVADELVQHYNNFEKALNLLCLGDISSLNTAPARKSGGGLDMTKHIITPYILRNRKTDSWNDVKPCSVKSLRTASMDYNYLFTDGEWLVMNGKKDFPWIPLKKARAFMKQTGLDLDDYPNLKK